MGQQYTYIAAKVAVGTKFRFHHFFGVTSASTPLEYLYNHCDAACERRRLFICLLPYYSPTEDIDTLLLEFTDAP